MDSKHSIIWGLLAACLLASSIPGDAQCSATAGSIVAKFTFAGGTRAEALLDLGRQEKVCFGMRNLPREAFFESVSIDANHETVAEIVSRILQEPDVQVRSTSEKIVQVQRGPDKESLFDHRISSFTVPRGPLQSASLGIQLRLARELDPSLGGFAGSFSPGDSTDLVGPFDEYNASVQHLLNLIVGASKGASWIATVPDDYRLPGSPAQYPMWIILQYSAPVSGFRAILENVGRDYPETKRP